ncbi:CarD family transcriptional regulator [Pedobacter yulinensis]|uniref:CarD family transcriptional regulator n=1 Tax=Pedobacter yulinensis TaxID=2126353 RepID=A0A2T3HLY9_9SPHI|nr:Crp/Fnr family transcriptional regulator [Pedobacter yulinensis]PST83401.1 CarD family transcriptional regulator [Pedobacter yulinensis]
MDQIRTYFERFAPVGETDWAFFSSRLRYRKVPRKTALLQAGSVENYLSFLSEGIVRCLVTREFEETTFAFVFQGEFISGYDSFLTRRPSGYRIETLTNAVLWQISWEDLQEVYKHTEVGNAIGRFAGEHLFLEKSKRELSFLTRSAEQRYRDLFSEKPRLLKEIPLKYLASYIGITPQALSRIRRRIT